MSLYRKGSLRDAGRGLLEVISYSYKFQARDKMSSLVTGESSRLIKSVVSRSLTVLTFSQA